MALSVTENGNVYDIRGLDTDKALVDTTKIAPGTTFFETNGSNECYMWDGTQWNKL